MATPTEFAAHTRASMKALSLLARILPSGG
jgi:hypothetical protein